MVTDRHGPGMTLSAHPAQPYVHVSEQAIVACDGRHTLIFDKLLFGQVTPALEKLLSAREAHEVLDGRAIVGGYLNSGGMATLYLREGDDMISLRAPERDVRDLVDKLRDLHTRS